MILEIYDIQSHQNLIVYVGYRPKTDEWFTYCIGNDYSDLCQHLTNDKLLMVGFGNIFYGYQILHYLIEGQRMFAKSNGASICSQVFLKIHAIKEKELEPTPEYQFGIQQIDLFRMWHLYNRNRKATLNDIKFSLRMPLILNNPQAYDKYIDDKESAVNYVKNNVEAIYKFFLTTIGKDEYPIYSGIDKIAFRQMLFKKYKVHCLNTADAVLGKRMIMHLYARATGQSISDVRELKTERETIHLGDCIPECFQVSSEAFKSVLDTWKQTVIKSNTEQNLTIPVNFHNTRYVFSLGGVHSIPNAGIYTSDEKVIMDYDVNSLYPSIGKLLKLYPEHLGPIFTKLYTKFLDEKLEEQKKENPDKSLIALLKLMLNAVYGNSNEPNSFLYDPLYTYRTTIAGQIFTAMWSELLTKVCSDIEFIAINTDGICCKVPKNKLDIIDRLHKAICDKFGFFISTDRYKKLIVKDINNYIAIYDDHTEEKEHIKTRGCFEIYSEYFRDTSKKIIPIALKNYFVYDIPIEKTIKNHDCIFDFCLKAKSNNIVYTEIKDGKIVSESQGEFVRYYIGEASGTIAKAEDGKSPKIIHEGKTCVLLNEVNDNYKIDYNYYISEAKKIRDSIVQLQLSLF